MNKLSLKILTELCSSNRQKDESFINLATMFSPVKAHAICLVL